MGVKISKSKTIEKLNCVQPFSSSNRTSLIDTPADFNTDVDYHTSPRTRPKAKSSKRDKNNGQTVESSSSLKPNDSVCCQPCSCFKEIVAFASMRCPVHIEEALVPVIVQSTEINAAQKLLNHTCPGSPAILVEAPDITAASYHNPTPSPGHLTPSNSSVSLNWDIDDEDETDFEKELIPYIKCSDDYKDDYVLDFGPNREDSPPSVTTVSEILEEKSPIWNASLCEEMTSLAGNHAMLIHEVAEVQNLEPLKPVLHVKPWVNPNKALFHIPRRVTTLPGCAPHESAHSLPATPFKVSIPEFILDDSFEIRIKAENTFRIQVEAVASTKENIEKLTHQTGITSLTPVEVSTFCSFGHPTVTHDLTRGSSLTPTELEGETCRRRRCQSSTQYEILSATGFTNRSKPVIYITSETGIETLPSQHLYKPMGVSRRLVYNAAKASPDRSRNKPAGTRPKHEIAT